MTRRRAPKEVKRMLRQETQDRVIDDVSYDSDNDEDSCPDGDERQRPERSRSFSYRMSEEMIAKTEKEVAKLLAVLKLQQSMTKIEHTGNKPSENNTKNTYWKHIRGLKYFCSLIGTVRLQS